MQPLQPVSGSDLQTFLSAPEQLLQQTVALQLAIANFHQTPRSLLEIPDYTYEVGQTPAGDWIGVRSQGEFDYNP